MLCGGDSALHVGHQGCISSVPLLSSPLHFSRGWRGGNDISFLSCECVRAPVLSPLTPLKIEIMIMRVSWLHQSISTSKARRHEMQMIKWKQMDCAWSPDAQWILKDAGSHGERGWNKHVIPAIFFLFLLLTPDNIFSHFSEQPLHLSPSLSLSFSPSLSFAVYLTHVSGHVAAAPVEIIRYKPRGCYLHRNSMEPQAAWEKDTEIICLKF